MLLSHLVLVGLNEQFSMTFQLLFLKVEAHQYDNPIQCYSEDMLKEMSEKGTWKMSVPGMMGVAPGAAAGGAIMSSKATALPFHD